MDASATKGASAEGATTSALSKHAVLAVIVAALGYFVDVYDLILFNVVRITSLRSIGVDPTEMLSTGIFLLNVQNAGLLIGGILWGVIGDKRGRLSVLFGSILCYSAANIANGFIHSVAAYAALRFVAGIGLAGELGAGITLLSELLPPKLRGYGTVVVACTGMLGGLTGALVGDAFSWRVAYWVGGGLGIALLFLRIGVVESGMFAHVKGSSGISRGNFFALFSSPRKALKYVSIVIVGLPVWLSVGILIAFAPEITQDMGMLTLPKVGRALVFWYIGMFIGDLSSGVLSQIFGSRKKALGLWLVISCIGLVAYFSNVANRSTGVFYAICVLLGIASGYWAMFVTTAAENFGTNLRATVTTTAPNFVRGGIILMTSAFKLASPQLGIAGSATAVSFATMILAAVALNRVEESFGKSLDYVER